MAITKGYVDTPDGHIHYRRGEGGSGLPGQAHGGVRPRAQHVAVVSRIADCRERMVRDVAVPTWNRQEAALRIFVVLGIVLLFVSSSWEMAHEGIVRENTLGPRPSLVLDR